MADLMRTFDNSDVTEAARGLIAGREDETEYVSGVVDLVSKLLELTPQDVRDLIVTTVPHPLQDVVPAPRRRTLPESLEIRVATPTDAPEVARIDQAEAEAYASQGHSRTTSLPLMKRDKAEKYGIAGNLYVATVKKGGEDVVVGWLLVRVVDQTLHIDRTCVDPEWARRGIGTALVKKAEDLARAWDLEWLTVRACPNTPWEAPLYISRGWTVVPEASYTKGLKALAADDEALGLNRVLLSTRTVGDLARR